MNKLIYTCNMCKLTIMAGSEKSLISKSEDHEMSELHQNYLKERNAPIYPERKAIVERPNVK